MINCTQSSHHYTPIKSLPQYKIVLLSDILTIIQVPTSNSFNTSLNLFLTPEKLAGYIPVINRYGNKLTNYYIIYGNIT